MCGGQALIEGIMMRGPKKQAVVVRKPDGTLAIRESQLRFIKDRFPVLGLPLIRGMVTFVASMVEGVRALMYSRGVLSGGGRGRRRSPPALRRGWSVPWAATRRPHFCDSLGDFGDRDVHRTVFPAAHPAGLGGDIFTDSMVVRNVAESLMKLAIFVGYLALCSRMKDIHRVFQYHGAEHKTIFCYEAGLPLTVENVRKQPRHHPRCGTSFLFMVIAISILVSTVVFGIWPVHNALWRFVAHLLMLPIIVGVSYEFNRWAGRHDGPVTKLLTAPGLWLQNFTTFEPDDSMIEVGIKALELVLPEVKGEDAW